MAITYDTATTGLIDAGTTGSHSHTVGSTSPDRILVVGVVTRSPTATRTVTVLTYNTVALTKLSDEAVGSSLFGNVEFWYLANPATGAHTLAYTISGAGDAAIGAASYYGVHQTSPFGTPVEAEGAGAGDAGPVTVNVGSVLASSLVIDVAGTMANINMTVGASQTERVNNKQSTGTVRTVAMSQESGTGTITMSWTLSGSAPWATIAAEMKIAGNLVGTSTISGAATAVLTANKSAVFASPVTKTHFSSDAIES